MVLTVMETALSNAEILKFCAMVKSSMVEKRKVARPMIPASKRLEMSMANTAQTILTPTNVQSPAPMITTNAQPEPTLITAKNKQHAPHAQRMLTVNAALLLQIAQLFANLTKKNANNHAQMTMDANALLLVLFKNVITMGNFALYTAQENVTMDKSNAQDKETTLVANDQISVNHYPKNCGVMMLATGAQDFALPTALTGKTTVHQYKTLVMGAQQSQPASQKQRTSMVSTAQLHLLLTVVPFPAKL